MHIGFPETGHVINCGSLATSEISDPFALAPALVVVKFFVDRIPWLCFHTGIISTNSYFNFDIGQTMRYTAQY